MLTGTIQYQIVQNTEHYVQTRPEVIDNITYLSVIYCAIFFHFIVRGKEKNQIASYWEKTIPYSMFLLHPLNWYKSFDHFHADCINVNITGT